MEVLENKNVSTPGNGLNSGDLVDKAVVVNSKETDPLNAGGEANKAKGKGSSDKNSKTPGGGTGPAAKLLNLLRRDKMADTPPEDPDDDPGPSVSDTENELHPRHQQPSTREEKKHSKRPNSIKRRRQGGAPSGQGKDVVGIWAHKCRLTPKRGLIYLIFCGCLIILLLFIILLMTVLWPRGPSHSPCTTAKCHLYSSQVLGALNSSVEPCDNFWEYSCGGWFETHPRPVSKAFWDVKSQHQLKVKEKLRLLLTMIPIEDEGHNSFIYKMRRFYESCMATEYITTEAETKLVKMIRTSGGWHVLRDFSAPDFDFFRLLKKIHGDYRVNAFFQISVIPDPTNPEKNVIQISPAGLSLPHRDYYLKNDHMKAAFLTFAKDVTQQLGAISSDALTFAENTFNYEKRLAAVTPDPKNMTDPIQAFDRLTVRELRTMSSRILWGDLLKAVFPRAGINENTPVVTPSRQYLVEVSGLISTTDSRDLNNYLMWHLAQKFLPYLHKPFTDTLETFKKDSFGSLGGPPRWEFCISEVLRFFPHGMDYLLAEDGKERKGKVTSVMKDMFERMKSSVAGRIEMSTKYDHTVKHFLLDKLRLMTVQVGNPLWNKTALTEWYFSAQVQKTAFFSTIEDLTFFQASQAEKQLAQQSHNGESTVLTAFSSNPFDIQLLPSLNKVIVPQSTLEMEELTVPNTLLGLSYGSVGVEMGDAISSAFGPMKGLYLANGALMTFRDTKAEEMKDIIESRRSCLSSFFSNIRLDDPEYVESTSLDTTMHLAGIQIALQALKDHEEADSFESLPGVDRTPEGLFFLSYAQSQCWVATNPYHEFEHVASLSLSHDHRVRGVLRQMVQFSEAFKCSKSSEMYADFTCGNVI